MYVYYQFKNSQDSEKMKIDSWRISIGKLKNAIMKEKGIKKNCSDLQIINAVSKEIYDDEETFIHKNTSVLVSRIPVAEGIKKRKNTNSVKLSICDTKSSVKRHLENIGNHDMDTSTLSEEDRLKLIIADSTPEYHPSNYVKYRKMTGPVPLRYLCKICHIPGHWINDCPRKNLSVKRSTGIPNTLMTLVDGPTHKGALLLSSGLYAVPTIVQEAYKVVKKEKPPFVEDAEPQPERQKPVPELLQCALCKELLDDAVSTPCCEKSSCDECIRQNLLDSENHVCPICNESNVSPDNIKASVHLRELVLRYKCCSETNISIFPVAEKDHDCVVQKSAELHSQAKIAAESSKIVKKETSAYTSNPESELPTIIPDNLMCAICNDLMEDAVLSSCCAESFCYKCIHQNLLHSENHACPNCSESNISIVDVVPSLHLRKLVLRFKGRSESNRNLPISQVYGQNRKDNLSLSSDLNPVPKGVLEGNNEGKKGAHPTVKVAQPEKELRSKLPDFVLCIICNDVLKDAVAVKCCGYSFCEQCIRQTILNSENNVCPNCKKSNLIPNRLIPNHNLRKLVLRYRVCTSSKRKLPLWNVSYTTNQSAQCSDHSNEDTERKRRKVS